MKMKVVFFAAVMIVSLAGLAKEKPGATGLAVVPVKGSQVYRVIYKGESSGDVRLKIFDASQRLILSETFRDVDGFICPLNFAGLREGQYTIELTDGAGKKVETVNYQVEHSKPFVHVSRVGNEHGKFLLSVANSADPVTVDIFDASRNLIYSATENAQGDFARVFTLKAGASYTFEVSNAGGNIKTISF